MISPLPTIKVVLKELPKNHNDEELYIYFFYYFFPYLFRFVMHSYCPMVSHLTPEMTVEFITH